MNTWTILGSLGEKFTKFASKTIKQFFKKPEDVDSSQSDLESLPPRDELDGDDFVFIPTPGTLDEMRNEVCSSSGRFIVPRFFLFLLTSL